MLLTRANRKLGNPGHRRTWPITGWALLVALTWAMPESASAHPSPPLPREVRLRAHLDGLQVVRPEAFRPPDFGSGSLATGVADLTVDTATGEFQFELAVSGIAADALHNAVGENLTAVHIHQGAAQSLGPLLIDIHHFAREGAPDSGGITATPDGFVMEASGVLDREQGLTDTRFAPHEILSALRREDAYITVHTTRDSLSREAEIRGAFRVVPRVWRAAATLDGAQVVLPEPAEPPGLGSGSAHTGTLSLWLETVSGFLSLSLELQGIRPEVLDRSHGPNRTAIHLRRGRADERGEILIDLEALARAQDSFTATSDGLRLEVRLEYTNEQAALQTDVTLAQFVDLLREDATYVSVRTTTTDLFRQDELRGNLRHQPSLIRLESVVDGTQVVRPPIFQPPLFDSESTATGTTSLTIDKQTGAFDFRIEVDGIDGDRLDSIVGTNRTSVQVHWGTPELRGPILVDVHHFARPPDFPLLPILDVEGEELPAPTGEANGVQNRPDGFIIEAGGVITRQQGRQDVGWTFEQILNFLRNGEGYLSVHTADSMLFQAGEVRGNLTVTEDSLLIDEAHLVASLRGSHVVRPVEFRPPRLGVETQSSGDVALTLYPRDRRFSARVEVRGISPADFDNNHGGNFTAVQVHRGDPISSGPVILDLHLFAQRNIPGLNEVIETAEGFILLAEGTIEQVQARHDTGLSPQEIMDLILDGEAFVGVHTLNLPDPLLFLDGELRGQLQQAPDTPDEPSFIRGDCDGDGRVVGLVTDAIFLLNHSFSGGSAPPCVTACDADGDGAVLGVVTDAVYLLTFNFLGGSAPVPPFPSCGTGDAPGDAALSCETSTCP